MSGLLLLGALALDRVGEPPLKVHPVVWMGNAVGWLRERAPAGRVGALLHGTAMALGLPLAFSALGLLERVPWAGPVLALWLLTSGFSWWGLVSAGHRVADALEAGDLEAARGGLSWLCSRDPQALTAPQLAAAATESIAENASDSLVAPLCWLVLGSPLELGLPALLAYRCVNTLDAMIGYRTPRYEWLGKPAARLDDLLNLLPARLTALWLLLVGLSVPQASVRGGLRTLWRDRRVTSSPNAGWPMATMAGLLGVRLDKPGHYTLGAPGRACGAADLRLACTLSQRAMLLHGGLTAAVLGALWS
ncbi:MAG: adenosylcobinamide-phosphate synthase CbiB [Myxococcota bacterium]|nr:adenosylcobinamide-phosphate synthase CbiB [Myxococcota bacterium]